jgi:hypothetical protein
LRRENLLSNMSTYSCVMIGCRLCQQANRHRLENSPTILPVALATGLKAIARIVNTTDGCATAPYIA